MDQGSPAHRATTAQWGPSTRHTRARQDPTAGPTPSLLHPAHLDPTAQGHSRPTQHPAHRGPTAQTPPPHRPPHAPLDTFAHQTHPQQPRAPRVDSTARRAPQLQLRARQAPTAPMGQQLRGQHAQGVTTAQLAQPHPYHARGEHIAQHHPLPPSSAPHPTTVPPTSPYHTHASQRATTAPRGPPQRSPVTWGQRATLGRIHRHHAPLASRAPT